MKIPPRRQEPPRHAPVPVKGHDQKSTAWNGVHAPLEHNSNFAIDFRRTNFPGEFQYAGSGRVRSSRHLSDFNPCLWTTEPIRCSISILRFHSTAFVRSTWSPPSII